MVKKQERYPCFSGREKRKVTILKYSHSVVLHKKKAYSPVKQTLLEPYLTLEKGIYLTLSAFS